VKYHASSVNTGGVDSINLQPIQPDSHNQYYNAYVTNAVGDSPYTTQYGTFGAARSEIPTCWSSGGCYQNTGMDRNQFALPNNWNLDCCLCKNFHVTERIKAQFLGEFYNILNHHNMYVVPSDADYEALENFSGSRIPAGGNIQGIKGSPGGSASASDKRRQVQLALRFEF
jgi:hypothetical protein